MNLSIQLKQTTSVFLIALFAFACFAVSPVVQAVSPAPDGGYPGGNTAEGQSALLSLTSGTYNTAIGIYSLLSLDTGILCTGVGAGTLLVNTAGSENTATGAGALLSNTIGAGNTASGAFALFSNTGGLVNTATGFAALMNNFDAGGNTAVGGQALTANTIGSFNTALGYQAGLTATGSNNVYIGAGIEGFASDDGVCRIGSIYGATITNGTEVFINSDNRLGTITSSKRFKQNITPTRSASEMLYELEPVTFQYKKEVDPEGRWQFGLVAEEVEQVNPDLVVRDKEGKPYSVRYDQVNAMLLNEFLKEHKAFLEERRKVQEQGATIAELKSGMKALAATVKEQAGQIQRVSAQLQLCKPAARTVAGDQ